MPGGFICNLICKVQMIDLFFVFIKVEYVSLFVESVYLELFESYSARLNVWPIWFMIMHILSNKILNLAMDMQFMHFLKIKCIKASVVSRSKHWSKDEYYFQSVSLFPLKVFFLIYLFFVLFQDKVTTVYRHLFNLDHARFFNYDMLVKFLASVST